MQWTFRKATTAAQKLPEDWEEQLALFIRRVTAVFLREVKDAAFVVNSDHSGCRMCPWGNYTYDVCGVKHVKVIGMDDKRQVTVVVGSALDGTLLPWQVIYAGATRTVIPDVVELAMARARGWHFTYTTNNWTNLHTTREYVRFVLNPWYRRRCVEKGVEPGQQKMLWLIDCWSVHCNPRFRQWMADTYPHIIVMFIPPNMTSVAQPADVGLNKPLKASLRRMFNDWLMACRRSLPRGTRIPLGMSAIKGPSLSWLYRTWVDMEGNTDGLVKNAWKETGLVSVSLGCTVLQ